jgi:hypothetical protein
LTDRARLSKRNTFDAADSGATFLGSKDFPPDLIKACKKYDPKGVVFGTEEPAWPLPPDRESEAKKVLALRLRGKKLLNCYGGIDKLVPHRCSEPFLNFFTRACSEWADLDVTFDSRVYPEAGHEFADGMVVDAVKFIVDSAAAETGNGGGRVDGCKSSRI